MSIELTFDTEGLERQESGVWAPIAIQKFGYSDGVATEKYLGKVYAEASDLSCESDELPAYIKDWPSEYHLTRKRSQLLSGFDFGSASRVLEVGCGCGAITRFLGETFQEVTSIEGSLVRAELARRRCSDLENVEIVCSPFQSVSFTQKFDIVICVGVLEYSASFVDSESPYSSVIGIFADLLEPDGTVVIAIENQFGMKYLNGCREDHVGRKYEGIEGYPRSSNKVRTFGRVELESLVASRFENIDFYYPYPDYKIPDVVLDEEFILSEQSVELLSQNVSRDYVGKRDQNWDESLAVSELSRNGMLNLVSDSYLVVASKGDEQRVAFPQAGIINSYGRRPEYETVTRFCREPGGGLKIEKRRRREEIDCTAEELIHHDIDEEWVDGTSLFMQVYRNAISGDQISLEKVFEPCRGWFDHLSENCEIRDGKAFVSGRMVDATWRNAFPQQDGTFVLVDAEWEWHEPISLNFLVVRAIYNFLAKCPTKSALSKPLRRRGGGRLITDIASSFGATISRSDISEFAAMEAEIQHRVTGADVRNSEFYMRMYMLDRVLLQQLVHARKRIRQVVGRVAGRLTRFLSERG